MATSIAARRAVPVTSATSRSSTTHRWSAGAGTSAASSRSPAARALARAGEAAALDGRSVRLRQAYDQHGSVSAQDVARAASYGDPVAVALIAAAGRRIGSMLAGMVNFFNPSLIVIGGGVANSPDLFLASIREMVYRRSLPLATRDLLIQRSSLGGLAGVIGASAMVVDQLFARESIGSWIAAGDPSRAPDAALGRAS